MGAVLGHIQHTAIFRCQFCAVPPAIRLRPGSEIQHHVVYGSSGAANQLGLERGRLLEVHAPNRSLAYAEPHVRLNRQVINTMLRELPGAPRSHKPAAIIYMRIGINHLGASDVRLRETHTITLNLFTTRHYLSLLLPFSPYFPIGFFLPTNQALDQVPQF